MGYDTLAELAPYGLLLALLAAAKAHTAQHGRLRTAVVHPCDHDSLQGALLAAEHGLIAPVLIGPEARIVATAQKMGLDLTALLASGQVAEVVSVEHSHAAAERAVQLARNAQVQAVMKGSLHTDELMSAVVQRDTGLRTARRVSHVFVMQAPDYAKLLMVTDAAINVLPDLMVKADIAQNAIDLAHALGLKMPRLAVLSAVETITPKLPSTLDAAALCKMADRGQIRDALVDGPLAFDNAISPEAAQNKGIRSQVAGQADILLVPDIEAGNMLAKQMDYLGGAAMAGIVLGARVPIVLTSRTEKAAARLLSTAVAVLWHAHAQSRAIAL